MEMFKVVAINTANKPDGIPNNKWIVKDEVYTVLKMDHLNMQNRELGLQLEEIDLSDCFPYTYFSAKRFRPYGDEDLEAEEAARKVLKEALEIIEI